MTNQCTEKILQLYETHSHVCSPEGSALKRYGAESYTY